MGFLPSLASLIQAGDSSIHSRLRSSLFITIAIFFEDNNEAQPPENPVDWSDLLAQFKMLLHFEVQELLTPNRYQLLFDYFKSLRNKERLSRYAHI